MEDTSPADAGVHVHVDGGAPRRRAARGTARPQLSDATARLIAGVTLDDLTAFITVGRLAEASGLSNGAIYSAYKPAEGIDGRTRTAPQVAARDMFMSFLGHIDGLALEIVASIQRFIEEGSTDREIMETLAGIAGGSIEAAARGETGWDYTHLWLAAAAALNDTEVREAVAVTYREIERTYESLVEVFLDLTDRVPVPQVSTLELAQTLIDVGDAGALRVRVHPETEPGVTARLMVTVFEAMTRTRLEDVDDVAARNLQADDALDAQEQASVVSAVRRIAERSGWQAVTLTRVGNMADVDRSALLTLAPTRHHLARFVWADVVASIVRRAHGRSTLEPEIRVRELVRDIADAACARRSLVGSLIQAHLQDRSTEHSEQDDRPRPLVDLLADLLLEVSGGEAGSRTIAAGTGIDALLVGAAASDTSADDLAAVLTVGLLRHDSGSGGVDGGR